MLRKIGIIGLGYVGLPVAIAFSKQQPVIAYDKNQTRINDLTNGYDSTHEIADVDLNSANLLFTSDPAALKNVDFYIVAVPTPVTIANQPDLTMLINASETIGKYLKPQDIVVYESTVFPGTTEEICAPILEKTSGLRCGTDFFVGYSPERINPGDKTHSFENTLKVVSGQNPEVLEVIAETYQRVIKPGVYKAPNIKTAEAAKVIENTQRDLNIALMNELAIIFNLMGIDTHDVLEAAQTKWNFIPFTPGLVGGHCIGVDPYYLAYQAQNFGYQPEVILAGRRMNDNMGKFIAAQTIKQMIHCGKKIKNSRVAVLGITFKENCRDLRNTRVIDIIKGLESYEINCLIHDPIADKTEAKTHYGIELIEWSEIQDIDAIIVAVAHDAFKQLTPKELLTKYKEQPILIDVKSVFDWATLHENNFTVWRL